jgi:thiamine biosynthesis lipoprotein
MATRFELVIPGDSLSLRALGEEALDEITRIEGMLSLYKPSSEVANLNGRASSEAVPVSAELFQLLQRAIELSRETNGAFDLSIAPLVRCWGFMSGSGQPPTEEAIAEARAQVGYNFIELHARAARFTKPGMMLDFGAFGKGYAIDRAIEILRDGGVSAALLHGGTSTVYGFGEPWKIAVEDETPKILSVVELRDEALSVSAVWGKSFASQGRTFGHILDARTGRPSERAQLSAVVLGTAADSDALSTALLVEGPQGLDSILKNRPQARALVLAQGNIHVRNLTQN